MNRISAGGPCVLGIDVSHYQGKCNYEYLKERKVEFAISKCTEYNVEDGTYESDRASAKENGIIFGGYDFFHPSRDAATQANFFLEMAKPAKGDLRPIIDAETLDALPPGNMPGQLQIWLDIVEKATGAVPFIYAGPYFLQSLKLAQSFARYPLYIAHYGTMTPFVPKPWDDVWTMHQYADSGQLPGIPSGKEDLDRFNGDMNAMQAFLL